MPKSLPEGLASMPIADGDKPSEFLDTREYTGRSLGNEQPRNCGQPIVETTNLTCIIECSIRWCVTHSLLRRK
jgi:hypothetical protein